MVDYSGVYLIRCVSNGKGYIGCSANVEDRLKAHKDDLRAGRHINIALQRAWVKYGESSFEYKVLVVTDDIFSEEIRLIAEYNTFGGGYNLTPGGEGVSSTSPEVVSKRTATLKQTYANNPALKEKKSNDAKAQFERMSDEEKSSFALSGSLAAKRRVDNMSEEELAIRSKELSSYSKRRWDKVSKEERTAVAKSIHANKTDEERRASALKSWETRRKNKEALNG